MWLSITFGLQLQPDEVERVNRVLLADRTHWTLDYIDSMDVLEREEVMLLFDAIDRGRAYVQKREAGKKR